MCLTDKPEISLYAKVSSDPPSAVKRSTATNCCTFVFGVRTPAAGWAPGSASSRTYKKSLISRTLLQPGPPKRRVTQPISSGSISCHRLRTSHCPVTRQNGDLPSGEADGGGGALQRPRIRAKVVSWFAFPAFQLSCLPGQGNIERR